MLYLYKDKALSGWGKAPRGSYVISDRPLERKEFKFLGYGELADFIFGSGKGRDFQLWIECQDKIGRPKAEFQLLFNGRGKPLRLGEKLY